jgi:uncharacterized metal-binding protein YceD (DUF177 family)
MDPLVLYKIPFTGLKTGNHEFQIDVDQEFFTHFTESEIEDAKGVVDVVLELAETNMVLHLNLNLSWNVPCGRCLEELNYDLQREERIAIQYGEVTEIGDDLWTLGKNEFELDLAQTILEMAHLARPSNQVHEIESDCDPKMLDFFNSETEEKSEKPIDPRWDALKNL